MQALLKRTAMAERQAARRLVRRKEKAARMAGKERRRHENFVRAQELVDIKASRIARKEDWELGPLAPKRDVGTDKDTYGTIHTNRMRGPELTSEMRNRINPDWKHMNIVVNDRVVILEGRDKGKIGKVIEVEAKRQEVTVEGLNMVDIAVPKWMLQNEDADNRPIRSIEKPISISAVKLVVPLPDETTGAVRDVIVRDVVNGNIYYNRHTGKKRWTRYIAGLNTPIPWPKGQPKEKADYDCDTLRMDVEARTFVPTLLKPPMPGGVIDELRNKYSIFRTRHEDSYIMQKLAEEEAKEAKKRSVKEMMTPVNELNKKLRKERKAKGKGVLTEEMLAKIGEVIEKKKVAALESAGMEPVAA